MLRIITTVFFGMIMMVTTASAQISTPASSPSASFSQDVGLMTISGEYSRPGKKGRTLFAADGLVPYGQLWRTGANSATKISFSDDVKVEGKDLKAGDYAVLTTPGAMSWDVHFFSYESGSWSSYREKTPAVTVSVKPAKIGMDVERFFITVADMTNDGATLEFVWGNTIVPVKVSVETDSKVMANIDRVLGGPSAGDYYTAGSYLYSNGGDMAKALSYVQKATHTDNPRFWQVRMEAEILAKMGKYKDAVATATKSMELAEKAGNMDYVKINKDNIAKWSKM